MMSDDVLILDVRTQAEFNNTHIENAVLLPHTEIRENAEGIIGEKDRVVLVYCRVGRRSEIASRELVELGFYKVYDFGGIMQWPFAVVTG